MAVRAFSGNLSCPIRAVSEDVITSPVGVPHSLVSGVSFLASDGASSRRVWYEHPELRTARWSGSICCSSFSS